MASFWCYSLLHPHKSSPKLCKRVPLWKKKETRPQEIKNRVMKGTKARVPLPEGRPFHSFTPFPPSSPPPCSSPPPPSQFSRLSSPPPPGFYLLPLIPPSLLLPLPLPLLPPLTLLSPLFHSTPIHVFPRPLLLSQPASFCPNNSIVPFLFSSFVKHSYPVPLSPPHPPLIVFRFPVFAQTHLFLRTASTLLSGSPSSIHLFFRTAFF